MTDIAYEVMSKRKTSIAFKDLWPKVVKISEINADEETMAQFYTDLTLDGRFVALKKNRWDLKQRHTFEETYINLSDLDTDEDEDEMDEELEDDEEEIIKNEEDY